MGNLVTGSLGQPESGPIVTGGLGASGEPEPGGYLTVRLVAESTPDVSIDAHVTERRPASTPVVFGGVRWLPRRPPRRTPTYIDAQIVASGGSSAQIAADLVYNFDAELLDLLMLDLV